MKWLKDIFLGKETCSCGTRKPPNSVEGDPTKIKVFTVETLAALSGNTGYGTNRQQYTELTISMKYTCTECGREWNGEISRSVSEFEGNLKPKVERKPEHL